MREDTVSLTEDTDIETTGYFRQKPDGAIDPAGEAGWYLQRERERRAESLEESGEATGIHPYHIEAIEFGDMTRMPARFEALEMIGIYAHYLGFDPEPLMAHYSEFLPLPAVAPKASHPANPAPLSSAKILKFGKMPSMPKFAFRLPPYPGGAGGLVASLAGAVMLFAGISYVLTPGAEEQDKTQQAAAAPEAVPDAGAASETPVVFGGFIGLLGSGGRLSGSVPARPNIITAPSSADTTITIRAESAAEPAPAPATHDPDPSAIAFNAGPNRKPSSDIAPSHANRRARFPSGVCSATKADTMGMTAATKKPVLARDA